MAKKILIVEDLVGALSYYRPLFFSENEVSVLILNQGTNRKRDDVMEYIELFAPDIKEKIKGCFVCNKESIEEFLRKEQFDFYIFDSLLGFALELVKKNGWAKEKFAFLSGTGPFRELAEAEGYRAYKKEDIAGLINDCLSSPLLYKEREG